MTAHSTTPGPGASADTGRRTAWGVFRPHRHRFLLGVIWLLMTNAMALWIPRLLNTGVEAIRKGASPRDLLPTALIMATAAVVLAITRVLSRVYIFNVGRDVEYTLRNDFYAHVSRQPLAFFEARPVGDLMNRSSSDLANVRSLFGFAALNIVNTTVIYLGNVPLLVMLDPTLALYALIPYPLVFGAARVVTRAVFTHVQRNQEDLGTLTSRIQEHLAGLSVVRAFARQQAEEDRFAVVNDRYYRSSVRVSVIRNLLGPIMGLLGTGSALVALWMGALRVRDGAMTVGDLVEFNGRLAALAWPTLALGWIMAVWQRGVASFERVNEIFGTPPLLTERQDPREPTVHAGHLAMHNVSVERTTVVPAGPVTRVTLKDVSFDLPANGFLGVVGATGSGKTTLATLIPRVLDPSSGHVNLDGVGATQRTLKGLRHDVALAPQEAFLFSMSVLDNLRFGRPDASVADVQAMVDLLSLTTDIAAFPQGLDTMVGERGITLSGGQRQRVALARALLCDPRVLVLDDTVSAVDAETEERILTALRAQAHRRTLVVTSHRLSAVKDADEILVLDQGRVAERGTHEQLLRLDGKYAALWGRERALRELERLDFMPVGESA